MKINTLCVFGTRPEAVKMAPVIKSLEQDPRFHNQVYITGQHQDMLQPILDLFHIKPDFNLNVMVKNQDISRLTSGILLGLTEFFEKNKPDCVLVHGDTTTSLTAAIAAYYFHIPIMHVEAGLRTGDNYTPWPEEGNRKLVGHLADLHFAPTFLARQNLLREGIDKNMIHVTGNTVIDALFDTLTSIRRDPSISNQLQQRFSYLNPLRKTILVTGHRRESFGQGFQNICQALRQIALQFPEVDIVYPVHCNPNVKEPVHACLGDVSNIFLIEPADYISFVYLMQACHFIITDSGGIQEEAPSLGKPVLVMRDKTERPEAIEAGTVLLVGTGIDKIVYETAQLIKNKNHYKQMSQAVNPYGDGKAAPRIAEILAHHFTKHTQANDANAYQEEIAYEEKRVYSEI